MGSDGGLPQYFLLEVVGGNPVSPDFNRNDFDNNLNTNEISTMNDQATTAPLRRIKEATPEFRLYDLEPGREYQFLVYAVNAKGRSHPPVVMQGKTFSDIIGPHCKVSASSFSLHSFLLPFSFHFLLFCVQQTDRNLIIIYFMICNCTYAHTHEHTIDETILSEDPPTEISKQERQRQSTMIIIGVGAVAAFSVIVALFTVICRRTQTPQVADPKPASSEHQMKRLKWVS